jgi:hypothetical protein
MTAQTQIERRQAPRMPVEWSVRARVMGQNEDLEGLPCLDISKCGLSLEFTEALARDTVVKLEFTTGYGEPEIQIYAFVAWSTAAGRTGLRFFGIGQEDEDYLAALVERFIRAGSSMASIN